MNYMMNVVTETRSDGFEYIPKNQLFPALYVMPDLAESRKYANKFKGFRSLNDQQWLHVASTGRLSLWSALDRPVNKMLRMLKYYSKRSQRETAEKMTNYCIDIPIIGQYSTGQYVLISGNLLLLMLFERQIDPMVWIIDIPNWRSRPKIAMRCVNA